MSLPRRRGASRLAPLLRGASKRDSVVLTRSRRGRSIRLLSDQVHRPLTPATAAHRELFLPIEPEQLLVVDDVAFLLEQSIRRRNIIERKKLQTIE